MAYNASYSAIDASHAGTDVVVSFFVVIAQMIGLIAILFVLGYAIYLYNKWLAKKGLF